MLGCERSQQLDSFLLCQRDFGVYAVFSPIATQRWKVLLPFSCDNLQIIQTILWFCHLSAYAHLPQSDSPAHYKFLVAQALTHYSAQLQAVFWWPSVMVPPFPWGLTHQSTILHGMYPMMNCNMTRLNVSKTSGRKGFLRFLNCRLCYIKTVSQSLRQTPRSFYRAPHTLSSPSQL